MQLRAANLSDINFILSQEGREELRNLIIAWSRDRHQQNLENSDLAYLISNFDLFLSINM